MELDGTDIRHILELVLHEFPVSDVHISLPGWLSALDITHPVRSGILSAVGDAASGVKKAGDIRRAFSALSECEYIASVGSIAVDYGTGHAEIEVKLPDELYYSVLSELTGFNIGGEDDLIGLMRDLAKVKAEYDKISEALDAVHEKGYGIVMPDIEDLRLEEPEIVRREGGYGVRLRAAAQSEELIKYMLHEFEEDPRAIWESNMFGKSLYELVNEGLHSKLEHMPDDARAKLSSTLERIINEGSGGLICIIL